MISSKSENILWNYLTFKHSLVNIVSFFVFISWQNQTSNFGSIGKTTFWLKMGFIADKYEKYFSIYSTFFIDTKKNDAIAVLRSESRMRIKGWQNNNYQYTPNLSVICFTIKQKLLVPKISYLRKREVILVAFMCLI